MKKDNFTYKFNFNRITSYKNQIYLIIIKLGNKNRDVKKISKANDFKNNKSNE